jgi:D-sedoheptulose 7-phosphate isomerase
VESFVKIILNCKKDTNFFFLGNGGSASIASHLAIDFTKTLKIKARTFHDSSLMTCFGNDYGYENWMAEALKSYSSENDFVVVIS